MKLRHPERTGLHIRVVLANGRVMGPGRAELLEAIRDGGSISAACRTMRISSKRAWELLRDMNTMFRAPVLDALTGGAGGGGARLTVTGEAVLAAYRSLEAAAHQAAGGPLGEIEAELAVVPVALHAAGDR